MATLAVRLAWVVLALGVAGEARAGACGLEEDAEVRTWGKLRWRDFQGPVPRDPRNGVALTSSLRVYFEPAASREDGAWVARPADVCIAAVMYKQRSYVQIDERNSRALEHEQLHFDITELSARRFADALRSLRVRARSQERALARLDRQIRSAYERALDAWARTQDRYDRETNHGLRAGPQRSWVRDVRDQLTSASPDSVAVGPAD